MSTREQIIKLASDSYNQGARDALTTLREELIKAVMANYEDGDVDDMTELPFGYVKNFIQDNINALGGVK